MRAPILYIYILYIINSLWYGRMTTMRKSPIHCIICSLHFLSGEILTLCGKKLCIRNLLLCIYLLFQPMETAV
jgi:hypothetical protein